MSEQHCRTILVTGSSTGIGAATALAAARKGYRVVINYSHNKDKATQVAETIRKENGEALIIRADVSSEHDVKNMFEMIDKRWGYLDALVNNAGILCQQSQFENIELQNFRKILDVNIIGVFLCCKEAVSRMSTRYGGTGGVIVNVSSVAAKLGAPGEYIDYACSKGAVDTLTIGLAAEQASYGIRVNGVRPGLIYTDIHAKGGDPERVERLKDKIPMARGGYDHEVAESIMWLLSSNSSYTTGSFIEVSGGR